MTPELDIVRAWRQVNETGIDLASAVHALREVPTEVTTPEQYWTPAKKAEAQDSLGEALILLEAARVSNRKAETLIDDQIAAIQQKLATR